MLMNMKELLAPTDEHQFAIPAFNISSYAMFNGIMDITEQKNAPVIIEIHPDELKHLGSDVIASIRQRIAASPVPAVIHLDHGPDLRSVMAAIRSGYTSVMIDASSKPFEENVAITKKVVEVAHVAQTRARPRFLLGIPSRTFPRFSPVTSPSRRSSETSA